MSDNLLIYNPLLKRGFQKTSESISENQVIALIAASKAIDITYDALKLLATNNQLVAGQFYRIIDFITKHLIPTTNFINIGNSEPIIILALSSNSFHNQAYSELYVNDLIFYDFSNNFCEDSLTPRPGYIYRRISTANNIDLPCDFRNYKVRSYRISSSKVLTLNQTYYAGALLEYPADSKNLYKVTKSMTITNFQNAFQEGVLCEFPSGYIAYSKDINDLKIGGVSAYIVINENDYIDTHVLFRKNGLIYENASDLLSNIVLGKANDNKQFNVSFNYLSGNSSDLKNIFIGEINDVRRLAKSYGFYNISANKVEKTVFQGLFDGRFSSVSWSFTAGGGTNNININTMSYSCLTGSCQQININFLGTATVHNSSEISFITFRNGLISNAGNISGMKLFNWYIHKKKNGILPVIIENVYFENSSGSFDMYNSAYRYELYSYSRQIFTNQQNQVQLKYINNGGATVITNP